MAEGKLKKITLAGAFISALILSGCTPEEQAFAGGAAVGAIGTAMVYSYPHYYNRPYYYYGGRYYYGGYYRNGYYYYRGHRYYGGHYYSHGYRYYNGRRYRAYPGRYGYYRNASEYRHYRTSRVNRYGHTPRHSYSGHTTVRERTRTTRTTTSRYSNGGRSAGNRGFVTFRLGADT